VAAWAAAVPAASAAIIAVPGPGGAYGPAPAAQRCTIQVITADGMPGWQITEQLSLLHRSRENRSPIPFSRP
jgi:hypothetical protein